MLDVCLHGGKEGTSASQMRRALLVVSQFHLSGFVEQSGLRRKMAVEVPRFELCEGQITAVIGGSGCGKSVLLSLFMGYPSFGIGGELRFEQFAAFGERMPPSAFQFPESAAKWRRRMNRAGGLFYLPQNFPESKVRGGDTLSAMVQVVQALSEPRRISSRNAAIMIAKTFADHEMEDALGKKLDDLSGGERRRAELLARLVAIKNAGRPAILILDEPTTGFDPANAQRFIRDVRDIMDKLADSGLPAAALLSTHEMKSMDERMENGHRVIDRACVVNRDLEGPGKDDCSVVYEGRPQDVFPFFFRDRPDAGQMSFATNGDELFERIREKKSREWLQSLSSQPKEDNDHVS